VDDWRDQGSLPDNVDSRLPAHRTIEYRPVDPLEINFPKVVKELNAYSVFVRLIERECECVLEQLRVMRITIDELEAQQIPQPCVQMQNAAKGLRRQVDFLATSRTSLLIRLREIQRGAQTQLNVVYNFTAQRDSILNLETAKVTKELAVASKRDSSAMKTIAVLTMVFLPGTFLAVSNHLYPNPLSKSRKTKISHIRD
jgi:Mg2+ and Co2+ transporter CorA